MSVGQRGERQVLAHRELGDDPLGLAVLGEEGDARARSRRAASAARARCPRIATVPPSGGSAPKMARAVSVRPEPSSPARPTTSPRAHLERHAAQLPAARAAPRRGASGGLRRPAPLAPAGSNAVGPAGAASSRDLPSIRQTRSSRSSPASGRVATNWPVAQHRHAVADGVQLVEAVADVDDADALRLAAGGSAS